MVEKGTAKGTKQKDGEIQDCKNELYFWMKIMQMHYKYSSRK